MKRHFIAFLLVAAGLGLPICPARAQIPPMQYNVGTEGINPGSLPSPGIYADDINLFEMEHASDSFGHIQSLTYLNEPRIRWISEMKILGANYGTELMVPFLYRDFSGDISFFRPPVNPYLFRVDQWEADNLEVSPLMLSWHLQRFDFTASYSLWVPTGDNDVKTIFFFNEPVPINPPQMHYWAHVLAAGGTWYLDAKKKWAVSALAHYEFNQSFDIGPGPYYERDKEGQAITAEWSLSRRVGKCFELGVIGNYARQTTATTSSFSDIFGTMSQRELNTHPTIEAGPEIKATWPKPQLTISLRYLRQLNNPDDDSVKYTINMFGLALSKRF
jgi:hypothetical protein